MQTSDVKSKAAPAKSAGLTPNQRFLLRLRTFPNHALRLLVQLDEQGQVVAAVLEDIGKVERFT